MEDGGVGAGFIEDIGDVWLPTRCSLACSKTSARSTLCSAALVLEITKVARAAVATSQYTTTPGEQREESLQDLRKAANKSASAEEAMRKHEKEARGGEENPGGPSPKNSGGGRKKDTGVRPHSLELRTVWWPRWAHWRKKPKQRGPEQGLSCKTKEDKQQRV